MDPRRALLGFDPQEITEIINDVPGLYAALDRVEVHVPNELEACRDWPDIANMLFSTRRYWPSSIVVPLRGFPGMYVQESDLFYMK